MIVDGQEPALFNHCEYLFVERLVEGVADIAGVGVNDKYKCDRKVFTKMQTRLGLPSSS